MTVDKIKSEIWADRQSFLEKIIKLEEEQKNQHEFHDSEEEEKPTTLTQESVEEGKKFKKKKKAKKTKTEKAEVVKEKKEASADEEISASEEEAPAPTPVKAKEVEAESSDDIALAKPAKKLAEYEGGDDDYGSNNSIEVVSDTFSSPPTHGPKKFIKQDRQGKYIDEYETNYPDTKHEIY